MHQDPADARKVFPTAAKTPAVIAHRTNWRAAPENTLAGIDRCIRGGFEYAEIDVRRTGDGRHVLMHDETLERTTTGSGPVWQRDWSYVRCLRVRSEYANNDASEEIPTLTQALELAKGRIRLYIDCRQVDPVRLVAELESAAMWNDLIVHISADQMPALRGLSGGKISMVSFFQGDASALRSLVSEQRPSHIEAWHGTITPELVKAARSVGVSIGSLTLGECDSCERRREAIDMGIDWIMTDYPDILREEIVSGCTGNVKTT